MKVAKPKYKFVQMLQEDHEKAIFSVQFNRFNKKDIFATVGANRVTVYKIQPQESIIPILCFADPNTKESFYTCAWAVDSRNKESVLLAAGAHGIIRIISPSNPSSIKYLSGHGGAINDLKICPTNWELVLSSSKDHSLRLWNIRTDTCIAIFGGVEGHRDEVLSGDFHYSGTKIVSCGMDHSLKVWNFDKDVMSAIELSKDFNDATSKVSFPTAKKHFPTFSTRDIHKNYVDCVIWYGNLIWSKSCENAVVCWRPGKLDSPTDLSLPSKYTMDTTCTILETLDIQDCDLWWIRFSIDQSMKYLALGNTKGKTYVYDIDSHDHELKTPTRFILSHPKCNTNVRQTCFSNDGKLLICACDDGTIWMWSKITQSNCK